MPLTQQDYFKRADESIEQYNARITSSYSSQPSNPNTPTPSSLPSDLPGLQNVVNEAAKTVQNLTSQVQQITNPIPANTIKSVTTPTLPTPTAPSVVSNFVGGIQQNLETTRKAFEDSIKSERDNLERQRKQHESQIAELDKKQQGTIENDVQPLLQPFRADLEKTERERLKVEENFFENQSIINEIQTLANGLQQDIAAVQGVAAPAAIQEGKIGQIKEDSLARIGILQAVVSMRSGQISTALNFIDRSSEAIVADRQDRLNYFNTLLNFYEGQKDEAGKKLVDVDAKDLGYVKAQIGLLENDLNNAQANFDNIRNMMLDPAKADILARSGVKLTDTPQQVAQKISDYNYTQEASQFQNEMAARGYSFLPFPEQVEGKDPRNLLRIVDGRGKELIFYNPSGTQYPSTSTNATAKGITDAIKIAEGTGGNYNAKGQSGEFGAYQFMPATWTAWSQEYLRSQGKEGQSLAPTPENQDAVAQYKVQSWLNQGYTPSQIASLWNSGKPNAAGNVGTNAQGVSYDTPAYVRRFEAALGQAGGTNSILTTQQLGVINSLTDNVRQDPDVKVFPDVRTAYETISSASEKKDAVGDLTLLRLYAKITDPTTGVREEEFSSMESAQGALQKFGIQLTSKQINGQRLTDSARQEFLNAAQQIYQTRERAYLEAVGKYQTLATSAGVDPSYVISPITAQTTDTLNATGVLDSILNGNAASTTATSTESVGWFDKFLNIFGLKKN